MHRERTITNLMINDRFSGVQQGSLIYIFLAVLIVRGQEYLKSSKCCHKKSRMRLVFRIRCTRNDNDKTVHVINFKKDSLKFDSQTRHSHRPLWRQVSADLTARGNESAVQLCNAAENQLTSSNPVSNILYRYEKFP